MFIKTLLLSNFRNHQKKIFNFSENINFVVGDNASGKTNVLESIFLLSSGKSIKASREEEMIMTGEEISRVCGSIVFDNKVWAEEVEVQKESQIENLEVVLTRGFLDLGTSLARKTPKKKLLVNNTPKRLIDFAGILKVVFFGPWDMNLVTDSPSIRRNFLDAVISQVDREYRRCLLAYEKGLRQRNKLLARIREEGVSRNQLVFWNQLLIKNGEYISRKREEFIDFVNACDQISDLKYQLFYDRSVISESRLEQYKNEEIASATTLVGPHRDDFQFLISGSKQFTSSINLAIYGSRGEQRMGVLWLKLAEISFLQKISTDKPVLLLDDILSELDHEHRDIVFLVIEKQQTIITTADPHYVESIKIGGKIEL